MRWSNNSGGKGCGSTLTQEQAEENWVKNCQTLKKWFDNRIKYLDSVWGE